ncbi:hypothetical protein Nepgr_029597 [Nepenthes gracilis]|uniref:Uncharacterized protein n=1 Tax=Nepenthes gracilis TaxID=150966 RepID=A0AAD3TEN8_NEPGR|nr:hypothetical protein Nepgr_029597 [Nepenthes gracilis]
MVAILERLGSQHSGRSNGAAGRIKAGKRRRKLRHPKFPTNKKTISLFQSFWCGSSVALWRWLWHEELGLRRFIGRS